MEELTSFEEYDREIGLRHSGGAGTRIQVSPLSVKHSFPIPGIIVQGERQ